jgi:RecB family exonuclease
MFEIFKRIKMRAGTVQTSLFGKPLSAAVSTKLAKANSTKNLITLGEIYEIYQQKWIDDWYDSAESKKRYYMAGKKILKGFYERYQDIWPIPLYLERSFQINLEGYIFKGRIDRIDKIKDNIGNEGIEIIDYKTGKYQEKLYGTDKMQLLIYQMALEQNDPAPKKLTYYYLNERKSGEFSFLGTREEIAKTKGELIKTVEQIKKSDFPAKPNKFNCKFCDFKDICLKSAV